MSEPNRKPKLKKKGDIKPNVDDDLRRLDVSRLRLLIQKYPDKTRDFVRELGIISA